MSRRTEQLASDLRGAVQSVIDRGLQDPRVSGMITVMSVRLAEDLRTATVLVSVLPAERQELTMHGLRGAAGHIRHQVGELVRMRQVPELTFRLDDSLKKQAAVMGAIAQATAEREARAAGPGGETA